MIARSIPNIGIIYLHFERLLEVQSTGPCTHVFESDSRHVSFGLQEDGVQQAVNVADRKMMHQWNVRYGRALAVRSHALQVFRTRVSGTKSCRTTMKRSLFPNLSKRVKRKVRADLA